MVRGITYWEPEKPDLGEPVWTPKQRIRLVAGFLSFITCSDFNKRFKGKLNKTSEFWRALCHRTFAYGQSEDSKINSCHCRKEFFRLKERYKDISMAKEYNSDLPIDVLPLDEFEEIEREGWGGEFGVEDDGLLARQAGDMALSIDVGGLQALAAVASDVYAAAPLTVATPTIVRSTAAPSTFAPPTPTPVSKPAPTLQGDIGNLTATFLHSPYLVGRHREIYNAINHLLEDAILTDEGKINWTTVLEDKLMTEMYPEMIAVYNLMAIQASPKARKAWMKRKLEEYAMEGGDMEGDVDGCFVTGI